MMRKLDKVSASLSFSPKYFSTVSIKAIKPLAFTEHEAMSIYVYGFFKSMLCLTSLPSDTLAVPLVHPTQEMRYILLEHVDSPEHF